MVKVPLELYLRRSGKKADRSAILLADPDRVAYIARRLSEALDRPLTAPGSAGLAKSVLGHFQSIDNILTAFAEKALETLQDGNSHNRTAISPDDAHVAVLFVAWNGPHSEVQSQRFGRYLTPLLGMAGGLIKRGVQFGGLLEIDAYVRDNPDANDPSMALDEVFEVDVEFSYIPGFLVGSSNEAASLPNVLMLNPDLCDREEHQLLTKLMARSS